MSSLPNQLHLILHAIKKKGGKPFLVGGYVRDTLLKVESKDVDVEVFGLSLDTLEEILSQFGTVDLVGRQFGTLKLHNLPDIDFSVPRKDNKIGTSHKDFKVEVWCDATLDQAASRRDLTMNSLFMEPFTGQIIDPFNGQDDIKNGRLRATDSSKFVEDDLRAVRVAQFISRFPQMVPDDELVRLCSKADLKHLPGERIWEELRKLLLKGSRPDLGLMFLKKANLLRFFPELNALDGCEQHPVFHAEGDVLIHTGMALRVATSFRNGDLDHDLALMFGILLHDVGKPPTTHFSHEKGRVISNGHDEAGVAPAQKFLRRLSAPAWLIDVVGVLVREHLKPFMLVKEKAGDAAYRRLHRRMKGVSLNLLAEIAISDSEGRICYDKVHQTREDIHLFLRRAAKAGIENLEAPPPDVVKGRYLLDRGMQPGPIIGQILARCRQIQDESGLKDPDKILEVVLPEFNV